MKTRLSFLALLLLLFVVSLLSGCASTGGNDAALIQRILDRTLPATFTGPAHVEHKNSYFDFAIDATGLKREPAGWVWQSLTYRRNGRFSHGAITLGAPAPAR